MNKWLKISLCILRGIVLLAGARIYYLYTTYYPAQPEPIVYERERVSEQKQQALLLSLPPFNL